MFQGDRVGNDGEITKTKENMTSPSRPPPIIVIDDKPFLMVTSASTPNSPAHAGSEGVKLFAGPTTKKVLEIIY